MGRRFLRVYREQQHVEDLVLEKPTLTIGRGRGSDLLLDDDSVSRQHATVSRTSAGYLVEDLGTANVTQVNGLPVRSQVLEPGDRINIGRYTLIYQEREGVALTPPPETDGLHIAWSSEESTRMADAGELHELRSTVALPSLRALDTPGQPRVSLDAEEVVIGRGAGVQVPARSLVPFVQAMAKVVRDGDRCTLQRLHALVAVRVNGKRCRSRELEDQDELRVGRSRFRIHIPARARASEFLG